MLAIRFLASDLNQLRLVCVLQAIITYLKGTMEYWIRYISSTWDIVSIQWMAIILIIITSLYCGFYTTFMFIMCSICSWFYNLMWAFTQLPRHVPSKLFMIILAVLWTNTYFLNLTKWCTCLLKGLYFWHHKQHFRNKHPIYSISFAGHHSYSGVTYLFQHFKP